MHAIADARHTLAASDEQRQRQAAQARADMHDIAAREVDRAKSLAEQTAMAPDHMSQRVVHDERPKYNEEEQRLEPHAASDRARQQSRR